MKNCRNPDCCKERAHFACQNPCKECGKYTDGCQLCDSCSVILKKCGHCMVSLKDRHKERKIPGEFFADLDGNFPGRIP